MMLLKLSAAAFFVTCVAAGCSNTNSKVETANGDRANAGATATPSQPTPDEVMDPHKLYSKNCAACHRESGLGGKMEFEGKRIDPDDLTSGKIKKLSDDKIANIIREGVEDDGMPSFKDKLYDAQIKAIISYIRSDLQKAPAS